MRNQALALTFVLTGILVASLTPARALAAESGDTAQAAVRFQRGVELYREGSFEGALAEFRKAYQLSPSYRVLYNIAQAQYALQDFVGAYKSLMQYTSEGGAGIGSERRAQVDEMAAKLEERIAHLQIVTNVSGADIRVDNVSVGISPLPGLVPVNVGTRRVTAVKAGAPEVARSITLAGKESARVELNVESPASAPLVSSAAASSSLAAAKPSASLALDPGAQASTAAKKEPGSFRRAGLVISMTTTVALAVGTGAFGYLAYQAQQDLEAQVKTYPTTREQIEDARNKSKRYGYLTDAFGAATLLSAGVAIYLAATQDGDSAASPPKKPNPLAVAPTLGGMVLHGRF